MALATYRAKRNFVATPEPRGRKGTKNGHRFVVQEHDARRLHYDFRLEIDGALKSWAVPRGPSLVPGEKRLAVAVEDHPLDYANFEGSIPKGEYGAGSVIVWDRGEWSPIGDARQGLAAGSFDFELRGEKLKGRWHLVRMRKKRDDKRDNWLLIKGDDEFAVAEGAPDLLQARPESVVSGRTIGEPARRAAPKSAPKKKAATKRDPRPDASPTLPLSAVEGARKAPLPPFVEPMLATLAKEPPQAAGSWLHEIKFDGYRLQARIHNGKLALLTRGGLDWAKRFGDPLAKALLALPVTEALLDGEAVVENARGASDFARLQADLSEGRSDRFVYYVFDLLHLDGYDLRKTPLVKRKALLAKIVGAGAGPVRFSEHFDESGSLVLQQACRLGLEGVVSKLRDAPYRSGRGKSWVKSKCTQRQEFVIGGFTPSTATRAAIGSLALGVYDGDGLRYVGRVGAGFSVATARDLHARLARLRADANPFSHRLAASEKRDLRFVRPDLVAEVDFGAWTGDGLLRHAAFRALREDKPARAIVRETPAGATDPKPPRRNVKLTHPDRVYWPDHGVTKQGLADYYAQVWPRLGPFIVSRPLALVRCPNGVDGAHFFQKHAWQGLDPNIVHIADPKSPSDEPLIGVRDLDGVMALVQAATLEIHPWGSTFADWERPDTFIIDLDPGDGVSWTKVIKAAEEVRARLTSSGLVGFVKTSGGKGLHVVAPLKPKADWPAVKAFAKGMAEAMAGDSPDLYVSTIAKDKRGGRIFIDYLRNQRGATAVAPYSTRARPGAAVSMPLDWEELRRKKIAPDAFTVANAPARLASSAGDPWRDFHDAAAPIEPPPARRKAGARR